MTKRKYDYLHAAETALAADWADDDYAVRRLKKVLRKLVKAAVASWIDPPSPAAKRDANKLARKLVP